MVNIGRLDDASQNFFNLKQAQTVEGQSLQQKDKKRRKMKSAERIKKMKSLHFYLELCIPEQKCRKEETKLEVSGAEQKPGTITYTLIIPAF